MRDIRTILNPIQESSDLLDWFGNSVVTNDDGSPRLMYHASKQGLQGEAFDTKYTGSVGFYFAFNSEEALAFLSNRGGELVTAYLKSENPLDKRTAFTKFEGFGGNPRKQTIEKMLEAGYDGWYTEEEFCVFTPDQIRIVDKEEV